MLRRWVPLLAAAVVLAAAFMAAALSAPQLEFVPPPRLFPSPEPASGPADPSASAAATTEPAPSPRPLVVNLPDWLDPLLTVACTVLLTVLGALLVWYVVRDTVHARGRPIEVDQGPTGRPAERAAEVAAAVEAGLANLSDVDADPQRAVIACWVRLEQAAAAAGTPRRPADTSTELVLRLLAEHRVSRPVLDQFAAVYRRARYGAGPVDESMRRTAVDALGRLRAELAAEVSP